MCSSSISFAMGFSMLLHTETQIPFVHIYIEHTLGLIKGIHDDATYTRVSLRSNTLFAHIDMTYITKYITL